MWQKWGGRVWTAAHIFSTVATQEKKSCSGFRTEPEDKGLWGFFVCWRQFLPYKRGMAGFSFLTPRIRFCHHLSFQLSWDLGKDLNAGWVKHVKGADHCRSCFWLQCVEGSANTEPLTLNTLNTCGSTRLDELCKTTSEDVGNPKQVSSDTNCK